MLIQQLMLELYLVCLLCLTIVWFILVYYHGILIKEDIILVKVVFHNY